MKSTGHEKCRVSVCLTAKADGLKLKPFIVFKNEKRVTKTLNDEFKTRCVRVASSNRWMNKDLTIEYTKKVLETFIFDRRFLARDSYEYHMDGNTEYSFKSCALNINVDGSEDDVIHRFKESQHYTAGREVLKLQMEVSRDL